MNSFEYFRGDVLRGFKIFLNSLSSEEPIGSDEMKASCCALCSSINNLIEYLFDEKQEIIKQRYNVDTKNKFIAHLIGEMYDFTDCKVSGQLLKLAIEVGNAYKHKKIDRKIVFVSNISQVKEGILLVWRNHEDEPYFSIDKGVFVTTNDGVLRNLELISLLSLRIITKFLVDLEVIDDAPDLNSDFRSFDLCRDEAAKTFTRTTNLCEVPQYTGDGNIPLLIQIYATSYPMSIRDKTKEDKVNFSLSVPVEVIANPYVKTPRS